MAEVQVEMLTDPDTKEQIKKQILVWEENLERLHCEQFRLKCYMASLQNGELPNPKVTMINIFDFRPSKINDSSGVSRWYHLSTLFFNIFIVL